jgi:hypothetical protein
MTVATLPGVVLASSMQQQVRLKIGMIRVSYSNQARHI